MATYIKNISVAPKVRKTIFRFTSIVHCTYYLFVFSVPFEEVAKHIGWGSEKFTISKLFALILMLTALLTPRLSFRCPPKACWCFVIYVYVLMTAGPLLVEPEYAGGILTRHLSYVQHLILFWVSYNLMHSEDVIKRTLLTLGLSCTVLAGLQILGITATYHSEGRFTAFEQNPNLLGTVLSLGLLTLVGLAYGRQDKHNKFYILTWPCFGILALAIIRTGSRGSLAALLLALSTFLLKGKSFGTKLKMGLLVVLALSALVWITYQSEAMRTRWERTFAEGKTGARETIYLAAWEMFMDKPLFGWGAITKNIELGSRIGYPRPRDTHNLYLHILIESGLSGAIPFFAGIWLCWRAAWRARRGKQGVLPIAMLGLFLVVNMKGTYLIDKLFWIVLAYALASNFTTVHPRVHRVIRLAQCPVATDVQQPEY